MALNLNIGILGHVDSGKTSLAKALSEVASTASFDKDPQSQTRGITLDLGFSSFSIPTPVHLRQQTDVEVFQYTLVDCPGHASLIKTVIGGSQIIDMILLVIDITKGIQTQTAECLVIGEITCERMIIVLNKIDLVSDEKREQFIEKMKKKIAATLRNTLFNKCPVVATSLNPTSEKIGIRNLIEEIANYSFLPNRQSSGPFLFAVDHCFGIKGQGTVLTGTALQGCVAVSDVIEIPSMNIERKIKSIQIFRKPVNTISQGDRAGICVSQFDPKQFERGIICSPHAVKLIYCAIVPLNRIKYFKYNIKSKAKFHITIGHETVLGVITLFSSEESSEFDYGKLYEFVDSLEPDTEEITNDITMKYYLLIEFDKPVLTVENALIIGSKLDLPTSINACRIAFWGKLLEFSTDKEYKTTFLPKLKVFKLKSKTGIIERIVDDRTVIVKNMFKKEAQLDVFTGLKVESSCGSYGRLEGAFGKSGKVRVCFENELGNEMKEQKHKTEVRLTFKKYIYDINKKIYQ